MFGASESCGRQSGASGFPGEVGDGQTGDVCEWHLFRAINARKVFDFDEEGQEGDGSVGHRVTDFAGREEFPVAIALLRQFFAEECDEIFARFSGGGNGWEMPHS